VLVQLGCPGLNFNNPSNGITNFRGFDNRHNTFSLSNVALDATWDHENLVGRLTLQVGHTASALNAPFRIVDQLFFAVRGDYFYERVAESGTGRASPICGRPSS